MCALSGVSPAHPWRELLSAGALSFAETWSYRMEFSRVVSSATGTCKLKSPGRRFEQCVSLCILLQATASFLTQAVYTHSAVCLHIMRCGCNECQQNRLARHGCRATAAAFAATPHRGSATSLATPHMLTQRTLRITWKGIAQRMWGNHLVTSSRAPTSHVHR